MNMVAQLFALSKFFISQTLLTKLSSKVFDRKYWYDSNKKPRSTSDNQTKTFGGSLIYPSFCQNKFLNAVQNIKKRTRQIFFVKSFEK